MIEKKEIFSLGENKPTTDYEVVLDLGNGAQIVSAPNFCEIIKCETILVNETIDGMFPGRGSEPNLKTFQFFQKL